MRVTKTSNIIWTCHMYRREMRGAYRVSVGKSIREGPLEAFGVDGR